MMWTVRQGDHLYVLWRGQIIYKRWMSRDVGRVMHEF